MSFELQPQQNITLLKEEERMESLIVVSDMGAIPMKEKLKWTRQVDNGRLENMT